MRPISKRSATGIISKRHGPKRARCLHCRNPRCVAACPVGVQIPDFISRLCEGDVAGAADVIARDSSLPSICGRVCPQETQCEGACVLGIKGEPVADGQARTVRRRLEHRPMAAQCAAALPARNGRRVAVVGSGPGGSGLCERLGQDGIRSEDFRGAAQGGRGAGQYGIPEFRLPKQKIVEREEIEAVMRAGRRDRDRRDRRAHGDGRFAARRGGLFDAVFIGSGAGLPRFMGIRGREPERGGLGQRIP